MLTATSEINDPVISETDGRLYVKVPWKKAEHVQGWFKTRGIGSTLHLDPWAREAQLELWPRLAADDVRALLAGQLA
jgi:hypothetical protein